MRRTHALVLLLLTLLLFGANTSAATLFDAADGDFLSGSLQESIEKRTASVASFKDKSQPLVFDLPDGLGTVFAFQHQGTPIVAVKGAKPLALSDDIGLPFDAIRLETWLYVYSTKALTLKKSDFPTVITTQLDGLWKWDKLALLKGHTAIAVPAGDILGIFQDLLMLNDVSGTKVLALRSGADATNQKTSIAEILIKGTLNKPFAIDMVLKDPTFTYKKVKIAQNWVKKYGVTGIATIGKTEYDFVVYDVVQKVPEIFALETGKLTPQNLLELNQAFSARLYNSASPVKCDWSFANIPTIEIIPRMTGEKVKIFAAVPGAKNEEMGIVGPGLAVSGKLRVPPLATVIKEVADFSLVMNTKQFDADFKVADLVLPGTDIQLTQAKGSFHGNVFQLSAKTAIPCLEELAFDINQDGRFLPKKGFATPSALLSHVKGCVTDTYGTVVAAAGQALQLGRQAYSFAADALLSGVESVFGEQYVAAAGKAAGYTAEQVVSWAKATGKSAEKLGQLVKGVFPAQQVLGAAEKVYGAVKLAEVGKAAGWTAQELSSTYARLKGVKLKLPSPSPIKNLYIPYGPEFVARTLKDAGFPEAEVKSALKSVYKISESAANDAWNGAVHTGKAAGNAVEDGYNYLKNLF